MGADSMTEAFATRIAEGRAARAHTPRRSQAAIHLAHDRTDPIALLEEQAATRLEELVPIRHGRMAANPFAFFRGTALIMASDLAQTPNSGLIVQLCGDAHLSNFGLFGTPERSLIFDINDFDETNPGPWEWDIKRLAASFEIMGRHRGFTEDERRECVLAAVRGYRRRMRRASSSSVMKAWYDRVDSDQVLEFVRARRKEDKATDQVLRNTERLVAKARTRDSAAKASKLVQLVDGELRIAANPPLIVPIDDERFGRIGREDEVKAAQSILAEYQKTLVIRNHPIRDYEYVHMARSVVGVGSVGTRAWVVLLRGRNDDDVLLLQAKEAQESVLERFVGKSEYAHHGERVVAGQRLMQAASDIFLGWQRVTDAEGVPHDFFLRQLHDWKGSVDTETVMPVGAILYAQLCGETLARAHARSGDRVAIAAYLGGADVFDEAIAEFAIAYADQNQADYEAFLAAIESGRLESRVL